MLSFPRQRRLKSQVDFQSVFDGSSKIKHHCFLVLFRPNKKLYPRLGMMISKRFVRFAVGRNKIKRLIRESFRHHQETLKGLDVIVMIRSQCNPLTLKNNVLRNDIDILWPMLLKRF